MKELRNRTALVTGAASGIGRCLAFELAREGMHVALVDIDEVGLASLAAELEHAGVEVTTYMVDVTDREQVGALASEVSPYLLVNCAGIALFSLLEQTTEEEFRRIIEVNLFAPVLMVQAFLPGLKERRGHIVNVASTGGQVAFGHIGAYCASKFALVGYSETLAIELAGKGVGVTVICPGLTETPILRTSVIRGVDQGKLNGFLRIVKVPIMTTPEKLARASVRAVKRERQLLVHSPFGKFVCWTKRLSPRLMSWIMNASERLAALLR